MQKQLLLCAAGIGLGGVPAASAHAEAIYGITNLNGLVTFDSTVRTITSTVTPSGLASGEFLVSIDVRPQTNELYGLTNTNSIYTINPATGASSPIASGLALTGNAKAIDFNPTVDRIRVISSADNNLRVHPVTGALVATDGNIAFAAGDPNAASNAVVVNGAYTNSLPGAATTTLFTLEATNNILATQNPPNNGTQNTVGAVGADIVDSSGFTGFDISGPSGVAYLTGNSLFGGGFTSGSLYTVNLATGAATLAGPVSGLNGATFRDIAVVVAPEPGSLSLLATGAVALLRRRRA
jgi:hypothetical protein